MTLAPISKKLVDMFTSLYSDPYINIEYFPLYINWTNNLKYDLSPNRITKEEIYIVGL
jgi:hypothetical protein